MARKPTQQRAKATVDAIIQAGFIAVAEQGLENSSTRQIAALAGVGIGTVYEYFDNKEAIFGAMNQRFTDEVIAMLRNVHSQLHNLDIEAFIRVLLISFSDLLQENEGRYLKYLHYAGQLDHASYARQVEAVLMEMVMRYVMQHPRYLKVPTFYLACYICVNSAIFVIVRHLVLPDANITFDQLLDGLMTMLMSYINAELEKSQHQGGKRLLPEASWVI